MLNCINMYRGPALVGELAPDALIARAEEMLAALKAERAERGAPPRAPLDVARLHEWLHSVRLRSLARDVAASSPPPPPDPSLGGAPPPAVSSMRCVTVSQRRWWRG